MKKIDKCLGCEGRPNFFFVLQLFRGGQSIKSILHGLCFSCADPESTGYQKLKSRLACLMFMEKNKLQGATEVDSKTKAAGE